MQGAHSRSVGKRTIDVLSCRQGEEEDEREYLLISSLTSGWMDVINIQSLQLRERSLMGSIIKKRRKKMRKHKHKKLRAKQRHKNK